MLNDIRVAVSQYSATPNVEDNLLTIEKQLTSLETPVDYLLLPENALQMAAGTQQRAELAESNEALEKLSDIAKRYQTNLVAGTLPVSNGSLPLSRCHLISAAGQVAAYYDKIHLFDAQVSQGESYRESDHYAAGDSLGHIEQAWGHLGLAVCYDLRFPELFRSLSTQGLDVLMLPAAFTHTTGKKHWETLLRARAIENQCYVVAANQCGVHADGRETWGHSLVIGPDGEILAAAGGEETIITATLSAAHLNNLRLSMPVLEHRKL